MIHQFRDKKQIEKRNKIIKNIIGFCLFIALVGLGFLSWTGRIFTFIGRPVWETEKTINDSIYNINYLMRTKKAISKENHNLIEEISALRMTMVDYQILKDEVNQLKEILGRIPEKNNFVLGNILTKPNHSPYDTVIIDVGNNLGVKSGNVVYANGNIPIGNASKIYEKTSLVVLYSNPGQKTEGFIDGTNTSVLLIGRGGGNFEMIIPIELAVLNGTIVYLPNDNSQVIAVINEVISKPSDSFKKILLSSPVNIQNLKWVEVKKD